MVGVLIMKTETVEQFLERGGQVKQVTEGESGYTMKTFRESFTMRKGINAYWKRRDAEKKWWEHRLKNANRQASTMMIDTPF